MQSGNGIDLAAIYQLLQQVAEKLALHDRQFELIDRRFAQIDRRFDVIVGVLDDHSRKIDELAAGVTELRSALSGYHDAVISQGIHYSELEGRVRRIERHLNLEPDRG